MNPEQDEQAKSAEQEERKGEASAAVPSEPLEKKQMDKLLDDQSDKSGDGKSSEVDIKEDLQQDDQGGKVKEESN